MPNGYAKTSQELTVPRYFYRQRTSAAWYVRVVPPKHMRHAVMEREFRRSTGHSDLRLARPVGMTMVAEKLREWDALTRSAGERRATKPTVLTEALIEDLCQSRLFSILMSDEEDRNEGLSDEELSLNEDFCRLTDIAMRAALARGKASAHWPTVVDDAISWAHDTGRELDLTDPLLPKLVRRFAETEKRASERIAARDRGDTTRRPTATSIRRCSPWATSTGTAGRTSWSMATCCCSALRRRRQRALPCGPVWARATGAKRCDLAGRRAEAAYQRSTRGPSSAPSAPAIAMPSVYQAATKLIASSVHASA